MTTSTTTDFGATLSAAIAGGYLAQLSGGTYTVSQPIVIHIDRTIQGALGIDGGGATLVSEITNGAPVIEIDVGPGVDVRYLELSNFNIVGNGQEGDGIKIVADGNDRWAYDWTIDDVNVSHVGGYGLDIEGSVFEGLVSNAHMNDNGRGGAYISNSADGGVASALRWFGGGLEDNSGPGLTLDNGTRDLTIDGATIADNQGPGISAMWGITSVTANTFEDNHGDGVVFQNYGNFNDNTFTTSGAQTVGISGYLGTASLIDNTSTYMGSGSDPTALANLHGSGNLIEIGNTGSIVTTADVATSGVSAAVSVSTQGVALPVLQPMTGATTAFLGSIGTSALFSSAGMNTLQTAMQSAFADQTLAHVTSATRYTVTSPIIINITNSSEGPVGIDLGGAKIESDIGNGSPVIEIVVAPGVHVGSLTLSNFSILGNGSEGDGIKIVADGADRSVQLNLSNVDIEHVGGVGLDVIGNVQGTVTDSWMNGNAEGGARFADGANGGTASDLQWMGGGFRHNGIAGMILDNGAHDMSVSGAYFVENNGPGIDATSGITSVLGSGFENNIGSGAVVQGGSSSFTDDTFSSYGCQTTGIGAYLAGGQVTLTGDGMEYYGLGADPTVLANVQGQGTLAISGAGHVIAGPNIAVTAADPVVDAPAFGAAGGTSSTTSSQSDPSQPATGNLGSAASISADGSALTPAMGGDLVTSDGTWSFGTATTVEGGHAILLNGQLAANGYADELVIDANGHVFANAADTTSWEWTGAVWQQAANPNGGISADGSRLAPGMSGDLVTSDGIWSFGTATTIQGGHAILLNGQIAANGYADALVIDANGHVFADAADTTVWEWTGKDWSQVTTDLATASAAPGGSSPGITVSDNGESFVFSSVNQMGATIESFSPKLDTIDVKSLLASCEVASGDPTATGTITIDPAGSDATVLHLNTADGHSYALVTLDHLAPSSFPHADLIWN